MKYSLVREEPKIIGKECQEFYLLQHQGNNKIFEIANVAYFKFESCWVSLYFEPLMVFWGEGQEPIEPVNSDLESQLVLVNLNEMGGVVGCVLKYIEYGVKENSVFVSLAFHGGKNLVFSHNAETDTTSINC